MRRSLVLALGVMIILSSGRLRAACDPAIEIEVATALDTYLEGLNSRDAASWAATLNYPQVRILLGEAPEVWQTAEAYGAAFDMAQEFGPGWDHSVLSSTEVLWCSPDAAYARVHVLNVDASDAVQRSLQGVFVLTRGSGGWGVQARFSGVAPVRGDFAYDAELGARHGLEEYLAGQQERSAEAMASSANLPLVTISNGDVAVLRSPSAVRDAVAAGGADLCGPLPELSEEILVGRAMVIMAGHLPHRPGTGSVPMPDLYVLTDQDGHWGVSGCAAFSEASSP